MLKDEKIIIISGPSGAGEDAVIEGLIKKKWPLERVITTITRAPRLGESQGRPYYFVARDKYEQMLRDGEFFEHAQHYNGNYYGVTFAEIERIKRSGRIGIWKIDYQGVAAAKKLIPGIKAIFIIAPLDILEKRIRRRSGMTDAYVAERMAYTRAWLKHVGIYDYTVVNEEGKLAETIEEVGRIIAELTGLDEKQGV